MNERPLDSWEARLQETARAFSYPATPEIARQVRQRLQAQRAVSPGRRKNFKTIAWALVILLVLSLGLLVVSPARAQLVKFIQVGLVRIFLNQPTPTPSPSPTPQATSTPVAGLAQATPSPTLPATLTPPALPPTATELQPGSLASIADLAGETTLEIARAGAGFPIKLPAYPPGLESPEHVFLMWMDAPVALLAWMQPDHPDQVRMSLQIFGPNAGFVNKWMPKTLQATQVNHHPAVWTSGPYMLQLRSGNYELVRMVTGNVLVWQEGEITYRLETSLPLEEAIKVAESLR